jgi:hypothetical protein
MKNAKSQVEMTAARQTPSRCPRVEDLNSELLKVLHVARNQGEVVLKSSRSDQSVDDGGLDAFPLRPR